jgi:beta-barrel assembly-enhancing protease
MGIDAVYFDGEIARDYAVTVRRVDSRLEFSGDATPLTSWSISGLHPIDPPTAGQPFRITHDNKPGARLIVRDQAFIDDLIAENSHLKGGYSWRHLGQVLGWTAGGLVALAGLGYLAFTVLPQQVAGLLPKSWRERMGSQVVSSLVGDAKKCDTAGSKTAISAMISALAEGGVEIPAISVEVYDMDLVNAFAAPGGRIVLTRGLLNEASEPSELTGVLAHELGHVYHLHPEAQLVRFAGLQIITSAISGGAGSDVITSAAGLATILRYTREAEAEADSFARDVMGKASVDPMGLKHFFEKIMKLEGSKPVAANEKPSALDKIGNVFSTHPGTEDRIKQIQPLPAGQKPVQIMTDQQFQDLKKACG